MHNWRCCCSAVRCCVLWYWQLRGKFSDAFLYSFSLLFDHTSNKAKTWIRTSEYSCIWRIFSRKMWYIYIYIYIYIVIQGLYISENLPASAMRQDNDHLLQNHMASHRRKPHAPHIPLSKPHESIMTKPVYSGVIYTKSPSLQTRILTAALSPTSITSLSPTRQ